MKLILIPTDYSAGADNALRLGAEIARHTQSRLLVLHAWHVPVTLVGRTSHFMPEDVEKEINEELDKQEVRMRALLSEGGQAQPEMAFAAVEGFAVEAILDAAADNSADLIVMGTTGASGLQEVLLGSNAAEVMRRASCPVLAVPVSHATGAVQRIAWCTDWVSEETPAVDQLMAFAAAMDATVDVVHVVESEFYNAGQDPENIRKEIAEALDYPKVEVHLLANPDVNAALEGYFEDSRPDLVAMLMRKRGLVDRLLHISKTRRMAHHTHFPLLAFHE